MNFFSSSWTMTLFMRGRFRHLTSLVTLVCFLFQTLLPTYLLAFGDFYQKDYTSLEFQTIDDHTVNVIIAQKNAYGSQMLAEQRVQKTQLQSSFSFQTLFSTSTHLPAGLQHLHMMINTDGHLLLTTHDKQPLSDALYIKTHRSVILGGFRGTDLFCESAGVTTLGENTVNNLFYKGIGKGHLRIESPLIVINLYIMWT